MSSVWIGMNVHHLPTHTQVFHGCHLACNRARAVHDGDLDAFPQGRRTCAFGESEFGSLFLRFDP